MPKFTDKIDPVDQEQIVAAGQNPADYLLDEESGQLIPRSQAGSLGLVGNVVEGVKGIGRGALATLTAPIALAGTTADLIRQATGEYDPNDPSALTGLAKRITGSVPEADPRAHWLVSGGGEALGNIGGMLVPTAAAAKLGTKAALAAGLGLGGMQIGEDTAEQEMARQKRLGIQDPGLTALKAAGSTALGTGLEVAGGIGHLLGRLSKPAVGLRGVAKRVPGNVIVGGGTEAAQQGAQDYIVEGEVSPENLKRAFVLGGGAQGVAGAGLDLVTREAPKPADATQADADDLKGTRGGTPAEDIGRESYTPSDTTIAALVKRQTLSKDQRPKLAIKTPVDDIVDKLIDSGVVLTDENVRNLFDAWGGMEEGVPRLERAAREMQDQAVLQMGAKPRTVLETVGEELKIKKKYDGVLKDIDGQAAAIGKALPEMPLGDRARAQAELVQLQQQRDEVMRQREMELGAIRPAGEINTAVSTIPPGPTIDIGGPGVRTTASRPARESGYPVAGQITDAEVLQRGNVLPESTTPPPAPPNPQVVPEAIGPAIPMGNSQRAAERQILAPPVKQLTPEEQAIQAQRAKERAILSGQEGEQSGPFGDTRYSGIDPKTLLPAAKELARRARQFFTPEQVMGKTYVLSGVAGLNQERPFGMQLTGEGRLPTSGLVNKLGTSIPKGELEAYKAAGLEEWLSGKKSVGREELQQWMMENGPQVEVVELRPRGSSETEKAVSRIAHDIDTKYGGRFELHTEPSGRIGFMDWGTDTSFDYEPQNDVFLDRHGHIKELSAEEHADLKAYYLAYRKYQTSGKLSGSSDSTIGKYGVEPRPVEQLDDPVEILVRVPLKPEVSYKWQVKNPHTGELIQYDNYREAVYDTASWGTSPEQIQGFRDTPLWTGGHHGDSGQNTLGFARANVETLPDGRRVLHVFELQSDWGQRVREEKKSGDERTPSHPLLKDYNRLTLKAAIKYAVDQGLDGIAISDPETAMMTEGHDAAGSMVSRITPVQIEERADVFPIIGFDEGIAKQRWGTDWRSGTYVELSTQHGKKTVRVDRPEADRDHSDLAKELAAAGYGQKDGPYIPQEEGMRFNYGNTLPKIAEELTGSKPEKVSFGEHWKAKEQDLDSVQAVSGQGEIPVKLRDNLIFKNPDGTPKTDISANLFSLDKPKKMVAEQALFTPFGRDQSYYSGIPPEMIGRAIRSVLGIGGDVKIGPNFLYNMHRSTTSRMAATGPEGAYLKYLADARLNPERNKVQGILQEAFKGTEEFLDSPEGIKWLNDMSNRAVWDISGVSAKHRAAAARFVAQMQKIPDIANSRGVFIKEIDSNGKATYRPHQKLPGYFPWQIGEHVYKADHTEYAKLKKDFVDAWAKKFGPNSLPMAEAAIKNIFGGGGAQTGIGAEPLFGPVRLPHGMTLPESWRAKTPSESLNRYIARVATDLGWAEVMQYDGVARRTLGIGQDPSGKDTRAADRVTWADRPEAWKYAVREGRRVRAKWALEADMNKPPNTEIDLFRGDSKLLPALQMAYSQMGSAQPVMQAVGNLASSILMQTKTATRDFATGVIAASAIAGPGRALKVTLENIIAPKQAVTRAVRAGSMQADPMEVEAVENGKVLVRNIQKAAKGIRTATARNILDNLGKTLIHDSVVQIIEAGRGQHLIDEFGPAFEPGMSLKEKARITANRLVERYSNAATPQNITPGMLPRSGTAASYMLGLTRWNQAQWNNFTEDVVHGLMDKNRSGQAMKRLLTWTLGASIGGAAVNKLWEWIESRKPRWMSWGELLKLTGNDKAETKQKVAEFAYSLTAAQQTIGAFGTVGDYILHPMTKIAAGETLRGNNADIQYPALIITEELGKTLLSFGSAVRDGRATADDFPELLWEVAKAAQNVRIIRRIAEQNGILDAAPERSLREMAIYERVTGRDTKTGKPVDAASGVKLTPVSDPFSFSKQVMGGADIRDYREFLKGQTTVPKLDRWTQGRKYYKELEEIIGEEEARKVAEKDRRVDRAIAEKNREIGRTAR